MGARQRILGIDLGIASCGWGVIDVTEREGAVVAAGVRCFDAPEIKETATRTVSKNSVRRQHRGQRRVTRRRRQRMHAVRALLHRDGLLPDTKNDALAQALRRVAELKPTPQVTPWTLRAAAHDRLLSNDEFAVVLGHIARHRGFRSNAKRDAGANAPKETSEMKKAMEQTREGLAKYRSFGDMLANDEKFAIRKRNREKDYSHTPKRADLEDEVRAIFRAQRRLGGAKTSDDLERAFAEAAFSQRPLQDSESKVGPCPFERDRKRAAKRAPSFELFRFLQKLTHLRIAVGRTEQPLTAEEIARVAGKFGGQKSYTFKTLRKDLDLDPNARFSAVARAKEDQDIAARKGQSAYGTCVLREALGDAPWRSLQQTPEKLDRIAEILTFREDLGSIRQGLTEIGVDFLVVDQLMQAAEQGAFVEFKGAAHISALAARNLIPGLCEGLVYSDACLRAGYDHSARPAVSLEQIGSPVTRRAFGEAIKQVRAVAREYGPFDAIHIELARDVGKSAEERAKLTKGLEERTAEKERRKQEAAGLLNRAISADELLRYELAKEQNFKCLYCDGAITPDGFAANDTRYQIDHILPLSRFGDDSYLNKTLCCATCNQRKRRRTPFEWFSEEKTDAEWDTFSFCVETASGIKGLKKRNFKLKDAAAVEEKFKSRNLTDTRWATSLLAAELRTDPLQWMFNDRSGRQVYTRPGAITSKLRHAWGLESRKKENGERVDDDRHHAVDALVVAATTESVLHRMTLEIQNREREGRENDVIRTEQPWSGFQFDVDRAVYGDDGSSGVFVSRAERRRARGEAHKATVRHISQRDGGSVVFERKRVEDLTISDLDRIKDPERNQKLIDALRDWIAANKPKDRRARSPKGDVVAKVRLRPSKNKKPELILRGGAVDRGDMARVDVFRKKNRRGKWEFYVVPIYPHQIATMDEPPNKAIAAFKDENEWIPIDSGFEFFCSLTPMSLVELIKSDGEILEGYFRGTHRGTGNLNVSRHQSNFDIIEGTGPRRLASFKKFTVDRLGRKFEIEREQRTWRGKTVSAAPASSSVASNMSTVDGVEGPASDAAE